ncbi:YjbH domain-containing protein [Rhodobacteraceae bacterium W635]|uniref:YjbH domain-containing protein n=1 Tax=Nioella halotolerans TaxID=2303578 RepID=UPI000E3DAD72|nr:YjbH domain-containing protein [Rhodobacteraceae bacterium W635]
MVAFVLAAAMLCGQGARADILGRQPVGPQPTLNFFGAPGLMDMPSAEVMPDGEFSTILSHFGGMTRNTLSFQITPRLSGSFRYSATQDLNLAGFSTYFDRSFDLRYQLLEQRQGSWLPSVAVGLQDFVGTGILAGEYIVASRSFGETLTVTGGVGWGRLGSYNSIGAPFSATRPAFVPGDPGGEIAYDQWFRGQAALFGGIEWQPTDRLGLMLEYSSDAYSLETASGVLDRRSPWNVGVSYQVNPSLRLGAYYMYGSEVGVNLAFSFNPRRPLSPMNHQPNPGPIALRPDRAENPDLWTADWVADPTARPALGERLAEALADEGQELVAYNLGPHDAEIRIDNTRYIAVAQALGRAARVMAEFLPPSIETFHITLVDEGLAISTLTVRRSDLEALEQEPDAVEALHSVVGLTAATPTREADLVAGLYPRFDWSLRPYTRSSYFDPDNPILMNIGARLRGSYEVRPGWRVDGALTYRLAGNLDQARTSASALPPVRTSGPLYNRNDGVAIETLTFSHARSLGNDFYGRVTAGYLERMYGGVSAELLWRPVGSQLAFGGEVNYAMQRDFDSGFGFRDYDVVTGHLSAYYDMGDGYHVQVDAGRYLAGDWGATLSIDREFRNGWSVGAFMTLTDVSAQQFGEGSFDKGIRFTIPVSWFTGQPSQQTLGSTIRPITRDGGARLDVPGRLYDRVRDGHLGNLDDQWAQVWR